MNDVLLVIGAGAMTCCVAISSMILRESTLEHLRILLQTDSTDDILSGNVGVEDFPALFRPEWSAKTRKSYRKLMKAMRKAQYGKSSKLLHALIKIEDEQQAAKGKEADDAMFTKRARAVVESYKENDDFSGFLAAFIEKRHTENM